MKIEAFKVMIPYRVKGLTDKAYTAMIKSIIRAFRNRGIIVRDFLETDILDGQNNPIEHVYLIDCYGDSDLALRHIYSNVRKGHDGENIYFA